MVHPRFQFLAGGNFDIASGIGAKWQALATTASIQTFGSDNGLACGVRKPFQGGYWPKICREILHLLPNLFDGAARFCRSANKTTTYMTSVQYGTVYASFFRNNKTST